MGGRGSLYSSPTIKKHDSYWQDVPTFTGDSPAIDKYNALLSEYNKLKNVDTSKSAAGYRRQHFIHYQNKLLKAYAAVERDSLKNLHRERLIELRSSSQRNVEFYQQKIAGRNAASGGPDAPRVRFYEKRLFYYKARVLAADSQLKAIQLRENVKNKNKIFNEK